MLEAVFIVAPPDPVTFAMVAPVELVCTLAPPVELVLVVRLGPVDGYLIDDDGQLIVDDSGELIHA